MTKLVSRLPVFIPSLIVAVGLLGAVACGAQEAAPTATATTPPQATATSTPVPTVGGPAPTPTTSTGGVVATPTPTATATPAPVAAEKPKRGGIVKQSTGEDPPSWDGPTVPSSAHSVHTSKVYSNLLWNPRGSEIVPDAAESYSVSGDGKVWTFKLRPNVKFQTGYKPAHPRDGTTMTSRDVKWSLEKIMGLSGDLLSVRCGWMKEFIDIDRPDNGLEVVDELTLNVHLIQPFPGLADILVVGNCSLVPDGITTKDLQQRPYGAGAFRVKSFQRGAIWQYERNPDYFKPGLPYLDGWDLVLMDGTAIVQAAFLTGKVDLSAGNPTEDNKSTFDARVKAGAIYMQRYGTGCRPAGIYMNSLKPPFNNLKLRQAVNLALDRKAWSKVVNNGYDEPTLFLDTGGWGRSVDEILKLPGWREPHDADVAEAKKIVSELYPSGLDLKMMVRNTGTYPLGAEFASGELKKIGINTTLELQDSNKVLDRALKVDYIIWNYWACQTTGTPEELFGSYFSSGGSRNYYGVSDPRIDNGYLDMAATSDPAQRRQKAIAMEQVILDLLPVASAPVSTSFRNAYSYVRDVPITTTFYNWDKGELVWRSDA
ncbi:MAG: ABC transporter substrate-binding protein [Chloroflexi bacterium]|nr:ABC transporter substrate-binding protein [Chloroflexota bacterium]